MDRQLIGTWDGQSASGDRIRYVFREDETVLWTVDSPSFPGEVAAKFSVNFSTDPPQIDIFEFEMPRLSGFRFLGIYRHVSNDTLRFFGEPRRAGDMMHRPADFTDEAIELHRQSDGVRPTG